MPPPKLAAARDTSPRKNRDKVTRPSRGACLPGDKDRSPHRQLPLGHFDDGRETLPQTGGG